MSNTDSHAEEVAELAREYLERCRGGERPSLGKYIQLHPHLESQIRDLFPMMLLMEDIAPADDRTSIDDVQLEQLGDFKIHRIVGRGGMGVVYEAIQESLGRRVALKVCPLTRGMSSRSRERFRRESRSAAMLHHTNIAPVFAVGEENGMLYYSMQFIEGATLDAVIDELRVIWKSTPTATTRLAPGFRSQTRSSVDQLRQVHPNTASNVAHSIAGLNHPGPIFADSPVASATAREELDNAEHRESHHEGEAKDVHLPGQSADDSGGKVTAKYWESVGSIGVQVAEALAYAHARGTLHRDIKPGNLMLDQSGTVWVLDFGLAKSEEEDDLTQDGELIGTLRYMAPEQVRGAPTIQSDVYSLGLTLYELLTLRPAFDEVNRSALLKAIADSETIPPRKLNSHVPRDLETIVLKSIEREPARRYASAQELADDLNRFLEGEPIQARRVSTTERVGKWIRRYPTVASLLVALASLFVASFLLISWKWREAEYERTQAVASAEAEKAANSTATQLRALAEERLQRTQESLYRSAINRAQATSSFNPQVAGRLLAELVPKEGEPDFRSWEWGYLNRLVNQSVAAFQAGAPEAEWIRALAFSHDDRLLAAGSARTGFVHPFNRSPQGRVSIWNVQTAELVSELPIEHSCLALAFSHDRRLIAVSEPQAKHHLEYRWKGPARIYDLETCRPVVELEVPPWDEAWDGMGSRVTQLAFSLDDQYVIGTVWGAKSDPGKTSIWDAHTGRELWHIERAWLVDVEPEGDTLTVVQRTDTPRLARYSLTSRELVATLHEGLNASVTACSSRLLVNAQSWDNRLQLHNYENGKFLMLYGDEDYRVSVHGVARPVVDYHPSEHRLVAGTTEGALRFWQTDLGTSEGILRGHSIDISSVAYSHSGHLLASGDWNGEVRLWEPDTLSHQLICWSRRQTPPPNGVDLEDIAFRFGSDNLVAYSRAGENSGLVSIWDAETAALLQDQRAPLDQASQTLERGYRQASFSDDGRRLLTTAPTGKLQLQDVETGSIQAETVESNYTLAELALSGDGRRFAALSYSPQHSSPSTVSSSDSPEGTLTDALLQVWDSHSDAAVPALALKPFRVLEFSRTSITAIALDRTGRYLAAAVLAPELDSKRDSSLDRVPRGTQAANSEILIWDLDAVDAPPLALTVQGADGESQIAVMDFSPDANALAVCQALGLLTIYSTQTGAVLSAAQTVPEGIEGLDWHPSGDRLAGANRELVVMWDRVGKEVLRLRGTPRYGDLPFDPVVKFSADGLKLASMQWDNSVIIWSAEPLPLAQATPSNQRGLSQLGLSQRGLSQRRLRSTERGIASLSRTADAVPSNPWYRLAKGYVESAAGQPQAALEDYLTAKEMLSSDPGLLIDSQAYIQVPSLPLDKQTGYTLEAWVKNWNSQYIDHTCGVIATQYPLGPTDRYAYEFHKTAWDLDRVGIFWLAPRIANGFMDPQLVSEWTHFAVTFQAGVKRYFTNGQLVGTQSASRTVQQWSDFYIGTTEFQDPKVKGRGLIRSLRVTEGALYDADASFEPAQELVAGDSTLLLFDFTQDDGLATDDPRTITDRSGNNRHGKLHSAWWLSDE